MATNLEADFSVDNRLTFKSAKIRESWTAIGFGNFWRGLMVEMTRTLELKIKLCGLNQQSLTTFEQEQCSAADSSAEDFQQHILDYVATESSQIPPGETFLATSDVIESLLGKYKQFSARSPLKQVGQMLLIISLCTMNLTTTVVKQALEPVRFVDVETWSEQVFGQSMLSKRKQAFSASVDDTETA